MKERFQIFLSVAVALLCTLALSADSVCKIEKTATGVKMLRGGRTLWNFEIDNPEGRPFFHPLALPSGKVFTDIRPKDHIWHLGCWFCWKYVNGVNYWEPADAKRQGVEPAGLTRVTKKDIKINGLDCIVTLDLKYQAKGAKHPVMRERRVVQMDPPDAKGGYIITVKHRFTANEDVVLDRTPPSGDPAKGRWSGGYAGATLRLAADVAAAFEVRGFSGGKSAAEVTGNESNFLDLADPQTGEGVIFSQIAAPKTSRFYVWKDKRMVNASPVYTAPLSLKKGKVLELSYRLKVCADSRMRGNAKRKPFENLDRGLFASVTPRGTYVSWRMLESDAADIKFDLWRRDSGRVEKINAYPISQTSDFFIAGYTNTTAPRMNPDDLSCYNHYNSRNQIAIAYLNGAEPFVVMERGTYGRMVVEARRLSAACASPFSASLIVDERRIKCIN